MDWSEGLNELKLYIDTHKKLPKWKNARDLKIFMNKNIKKKFGEEKFKLWKEFTYSDTYVNYFTIDFEKYKENIDKLANFVIENERKPYKLSGDSTEFPLLQIWRKFKNTNNYKFYNNAHLIKQLYMQFFEHPTIASVFKRDIDKWTLGLNKLKTYLETNGNLPENGKIKFWYTYQMKHCHNENPIYSHEIIALWNNFLNSDLHKLSLKN